MTKQIDVTCPCCQTRLTVDVRTSQVLRFARPSEVDETGKAVLDPARWDEAVERVQGRTRRVADELESGLSRERDKERHLDDLFDAARKKHLRPPAEGGE
jgi:hypothetical protein